MEIVYQSWFALSSVDNDSDAENEHLCFIIVFNGDLFVSRDDPLMS